jgi:hypothetical protein
MRAKRAALATVLAAAALAWPGRVGAVDREACFSSAESAQQLRTQDKLRAARNALLVCAQDGCPPTVQKDCVKWLNEVKDALPTIVVSAHDTNGGDLSDVSVSVDGARVAQRLDGRPIEVDPGSHTLRIEREGSIPVDKSIVVAAGQRLREISVEIDTGAPAPPPEQPGAPARIPLLSIVLGAAGAVALGSMTYFWVSGRSDFSSLEGSCKPSCDPSSVDPVRTKLVVGDVSLGVAVVSLGLATWFYLRRPTSAPAAPTAAVGVAPSPGGALAAMRLSF